ncbi:peptidase M23 [Roseibium sediminis]|uniref:peptidase M23 n=1 Tax=Roseibium sediminis TaxID=1775174 RepID=UPI00123DAE2C|nr:peptidase M23 [Roseibium sediminis]
MRFLVSSTFAILASPALAHEGLHVHPHGMDSVLLLALGAAAVAAAIYVVRK